MTLRRLPQRAAALVAILAIVSCASSSFKKTSEVILQTSPVAYDTAMTFAETNKTRLSLETLKAFETVRVQFPPAYRAFDSGFAAYVKSGATDPGEVKALRDEVERLVDQVQALLVLNGGPDLGGKK